jgi:hypothetical protein
MEQIHEILTLDLHEDIKNVIDLEDGTETEIQQEIESYIVTEGIGKHLDRFTGIYTSNIKETGVWLSGFYGSGKSYFGKMLGYLLANPTINGTPFRERFIPRLQGISDAVLLENGLLKLDSISGLVVFLDVAKQNTENGLAFTLFVNLLKRLGLRDDIYGYIEFDLLLDGKLSAFKDKVKASEGEDWETLKRSNLKVARTMRRTFLEMDYSEEDYRELHETFTAAIQNFSSSKFKEELERYLKHKPDERLVFIFDEASEAISQKKFTLLDLEGLSESLSSLSSRVWTIAIAQEKLDDVINNANVNRSQLTKVTDRFKTKIHLESTEVDVIIRSRVLHKKTAAHEALEAFYQGNEGMVADATNLKSSFPTKTTSATEFADYYPFHRYQFDILQRFLFSSNALVATQVAARGMIITTFDVLRKQMRDCQLHAFTTGHAICTEAQTAPPVGLVSKYETARKILREQMNPLDGKELLKTVHLLSDSEVVSATVENITKSHISDISTYYSVKPEVESALSILVERKVLLVSNHLYKITSDLEGKLLEDMKDFDVELFSKKRSLINSIRDQKLFAAVSTYNDGTEAYKFSVLSDQDDELSGAGSKQLRIVVYSLFNIGDNRADFIEKVKLDTQHDKERITLVPQDGDFALIDKLIGEISRYLYIEEKYANDADPDKRKIIRDFASIREEKEKDLRRKIEGAYWHGTLIYLFDEYALDPDKARVIIGENQKKLVRNVYTKRLPNQLLESLIPKLFSCRKDQLSGLFSGDDFKFFDTHGNFVGDHLKVVEEVTAKIKTRYLDGKSLEADLSGAPWGYRFGTIVTTLAALLRAGRLSLKHNGDTWFSHEQKGAHDAFTNATRFKSASFKTVAVKLTAAQKNQAVQLLIDLEIETHTGRKVDYNTNDFDLADGIVAMADHFGGVLGTLHETVERFDSLFPKVVAQKQVLQGFGGKATEGNYIEKVEFLLANADAFREAVQTILQAQKFIKKQFPKVRQFKAFIDAVEAELRKADRKDPDIAGANAQFNDLFQKDMVGNYAALQQQVQVVKDSYFKLLKNAAAGLTHQYQLFAGKVTAARQDLSQNYPADLNGTSLRGLDTLDRYAKERIVPEPDIEYATTCRHCGYSLSDMLNYTALVPSKETELHLLQAGFVKVAPTPEPAGGGGGDPDPQTPAKPRRIQLRLHSRRMTVQEYKAILTAQITALATANPEDTLEIDVEVD